MYFVTSLKSSRYTFLIYRRIVLKTTSYLLYLSPSALGFEDFFSEDPTCSWSLSEAEFARELSESYVKELDPLP
jgi:hypothetical protein